MPTRKWQSDDAGCLLTGHLGWQAHADMVDLAVESGYPISDQDRAVLEAYRAGESGDGRTPAPGTKIHTKLWSVWCTDT